MYISVFSLNPYFKCNFWRMLVLRNRCINLFPEKFNLDQIPIAFREICSDPLEYFSVSSSTRSMGNWNYNFCQILLFMGKIYIFLLSAICHHWLKRTPTALNKSVLTISFRKVKKKWILCQKLKYYCFGEQKKSWHTY